jgi:hypothetical protein
MNILSRRQRRHFHVCFCIRQRPYRRWYPCSDVVVGFVWSDDLETYVDGSAATGRVSHARKINGDDPERERERDTLVLQVRGRAWDRQLHHVKNAFVTKISSKMPQMGLREEWMCLLREASLAPYVVGLAASKQRIYHYLFVHLFISLTSEFSHNGDYKYPHLLERNSTWNCSNLPSLEKPPASIFRPNTGKGSPLECQ